MKNIVVIVSDNDNHAVSDWNLKKWYESIQDADTVFVGTTLMLNELRLGVMRGEIAPFRFVFSGVDVLCDEQGVLSNWPEGLGDQLADQMKALMKGE